jgi:ABC-type Mn2+/Zn2+ transport system permease subunit
VTATVWHALSEPWSEPLVRRAGVEVALLALVAGTLGCWIVLYRLSYGTESLSHALLPGLVVAALTGIPLLLGGALGLLIAVVAIGLAQRIEGIDSDTAVAVAITSMLGVGALLALAPASPPGIEGILFGDVLAVSNTDLVAAVLLAVLVLSALRVLHGRLLVAGFDRATAQALGARPLIAELALLALVAATIVIAVQALGNLLVVALVVGPAAAARLVSDRLVPMMGVGVLTALAGGFGGLYLSYYAGTAGGASIAAAIVALYLLAAAVTGRGGSKALGSAAR